MITLFMSILIINALSNGKVEYFSSLKKKNETKSNLLME